MKIKYIPTIDARNIEFNKFIEKTFPEFIDEKNPGLILVTGGDGALLHAIQQFNNLQVPFFGHASGTLNFMMNDFKDVKETLSKIKSGRIKLHLMETSSIKVSLVHGGKSKLIGYSVNEIVLGSEIMGYHHFEMVSSDKSFDGFEIKGSGVCVSTDLGSTGYNFNLGGSVLPIGSGLWSIIGVACNRYLNDILEVGSMQIKTTSTRKGVHLYLDGIKQDIQIVAGDSIKLEKGQKIKIAFLDHNNFLKKRIEITSRLRKG